MSNVKQVKVDNWGIYFLQRLKHFFNRTDFCDLTLQFQDNAQLKVHRLVLSACTEYFELLERTCEMYEDCLVMPDDLQADVVVPIVNFMYTGQLEFKMDLLEKLYQTSQIMHMPVLTKLLEAHRNTTVKPAHCYTGKRRRTDSTPSTSSKRSCNKTFDNSTAHTEKKVYVPIRAREESFIEPSSSQIEFKPINKQYTKDPRPTRYEIPEELDTDNVFDNSFCNISYTSKPLMVHPDTVKRYSANHNSLFSEASSSKRFSNATTTMDIVECKKISNDNIFEDTELDHSLIDESNVFQPTYLTVKNSMPKDPNQLFDQILDQNDTTKVTIENKNSKGMPSLDHAKIISEVLKKYSHVLKGSKNIKLKILNTPKRTGKKQKSMLEVENKPQIKEELEYTYETDVIDSKQAAKLITMGAENIKGPWICLICGTPGRALHFPTYYKFRRHLVEVHKEKPVVNICEYCGHKALKRNYLLHHLYSKHDIKPPSQYNFPKCNFCDYIALSETLLVKHKLTHSALAFRCNVCAKQFSTSRLLLMHIQNTGHKYTTDKRNNVQCIYCLKLFLRENNLVTHMKSYHKIEAKSDGILEDSDEDIPLREEKERRKNYMKTEVKMESSLNCPNDYEEVDVQYQIQPDGNIHVISSKKQKNPPLKQKILNSGLNTENFSLKSNTKEDAKNDRSGFLHHRNDSSLNYENDEEDIVTIDNNEYIVKNNQLIPRKTKATGNDEYIVPEIIDSNQNSLTATPTTSMEFSNMHSTNIIGNIQQSSMIVSKSNDLNQPIQFVVSNEEEYKALIASNNPIIFDNVGDNKTLTVLTAPHGTTLDTATINLNNAQSNDMMIIQEEFPLNVSDNVTADNSNIVVVYSHPVDNQNKQYQLLTTQAIGAQFVPSSAIITQSYETVTTTAPVVGAHVISTQEVWQNDVHQTITNQGLQITTQSNIQTIDKITTQSNIQTIDKPEVQIITQENINESNLNELPEVHLLPESQNTIVIPQTNEINESVNKVSEIPMNGEAVISEQEVVTLSMETKSLDDEIQAVKKAGNTCNSEIIVMVGDDNSQAISQIETEVAIVIPQIAENQKIIEQTAPTTCLSPTFTQEVEKTEESAVENIKENNDQRTEDHTLHTFTQEVEETEESAVENINEHNDQSTEDHTLPNGTMEQIQHLTSEWSEDECEAQNPVSNSKESPNNEMNNDSLPLENKIKEIEESIENIQQEVEKQSGMVIEVNIEDQGNKKLQISDTSKPDVSIENQLETSAPAEEINAPPEKISSLLNEWDDNDSEEASTEQITDNIITPVGENSEEATTTAVADKKDNQIQSKPDDNIKQLVSDWDDDDENKD